MTRHYRRRPLPLALAAAFLRDTVRALGTIKATVQGRRVS